MKRISDISSRMSWPTTNHLAILPPIIAAILASFGISGCVVGPNYVPPQPFMPDAWHQAATEGLAEGETNLRAWWTSLNDPVLDKLIERAASGNLDLKQAFGRIREARARRGIATGDYYPDINSFGDAVRFRRSEETSPVLPSGTRNDNLFDVGIDTTWEIDVFGRISRSIESADATMEASVENYRDVLVLLYAEVARNYVEARALQTRIRFTQGNIETQRQTLKLTQDRQKAEIAPELDVRQAELNLARTESALPTLRFLLAQTIHRLGVLAGEHPGALYEILSQEASIPNTPNLVQVGLPAELLRQRPDVRQAERALAAQHAQIGVATADLYPRFSLLGTFALEAPQGGDVFNNRSFAYSFGPAVRWNLFDGGRVRNNIKAQDALTQQSLARYEQTVLTALEEVENAMVAYVEEGQRRDALARSVDAARKSAELVTTLYKTGLTDFQNVQDSERSLAVQEDQLAESQGNVVTNLIQIYKALGGGWQPDPPKLEQEVADQQENGEPIL